MGASVWESGAKIYVHILLGRGGEGKEVGACLPECVGKEVGE